MPTKITMPQLGESVSEGTIGRWLKREGETVKRDESLVEIITDKVTAELPSPVSGRLTKILVGDDQTVKVGVEIGEIDEGGAGNGATTNGASAASPASAAPAAPAVSSATTASASPATAPAMSMVGSANGSGGSGGSGGANGASATPSATATLARPAKTEKGPEKVSPLARRLAEEHHLDLSQVPGTGEGGRVRKEDIQAYLAQGAPIAVATPVATTPTYAPAANAVPARLATPTPVFAGDEVITPSPARRAIAEHMVRSKHISPHATTLVEVDMTNLGRWLDAHKDDFKRREGYGVSFQTFVVKAAVEALKEHPYLNASWTADDKIVIHKQINIGVSIALENNLMVPVIRDADSLNIAGIARAVNDLVSRARSHRLMPADLQGGTFTVNNPGVFGTLISMAIINQPNAGILTMDSVVKRPVVIDDAIAIRQMMYLSLSFDHRVIDGMTAAQFLVAIKHRLEIWGPEIDVY